MESIIDPAALRKQLIVAKRRHNLYDRAAYAEVAAAEAHAAHQQVLRRRDVVVAALHHQHDWPVSRLEYALGAGIRNRAALQAALDDNPEPEPIDNPEAELDRLVQLGKDLHAVWQQGVEAAREARQASRAQETQEAQPDELLLRLKQQLADELAETVTRRNQLAAGVVAHRGWPTMSAARVAGTSAGRVDEVEPAADTTDLPEQLLEAVKTVRRLTADLAAIESIRKQVQGQGNGGAARLGALTEVPDDLPARVSDCRSTADPATRKRLVAGLVKEVWALLTQVVAERTIAAAHLHTREGWPLARLLEAINPGSRNQAQLRGQIDQLGATPPVVDNPVAVLADRVAAARALTELRRELNDIRKEAAGS